MARPVAVVARALSVVLGAALLAGCTHEGAPARRPWKDAPPTVAAIPAPADGNGVAALSPADVLAKAIAATAAATSVRVTGSVSSAYQTSASRDQSDPDFAIDMLFTNTGSTGAITDAGATLRVLRVQREIWLGGQDFWTRLTSERAAPGYQGKYVPIAVGDSSLAPIVDATYLVPLLNKLLRVGPAGLAKGQPAVVAGVPAIALVSSGRDFGGTVWVATRGQPHVLRVETGKNSELTGSLDFTDYDQRVPLTPPAPSQVVDPNDLSVPLRRPLGAVVGPKGASPSPAGSPAASGGAGNPPGPQGATPGPGGHGPQPPPGASSSPKPGPTPPTPPVSRRGLATPRASASPVA